MKIKKTTAQVTLEIATKCPYCRNYIIIDDDYALRADLDRNLSCLECEHYIICNKCEKDFIINEIIY